MTRKTPKIDPENLSISPQEKDEYINLLEKIPSNQLSLLEKRAILDVLDGKSENIDQAHNAFVRLNVYIEEQLMGELLEDHEKDLYKRFLLKASIQLKMTMRNTSLPSLQNILRPIMKAIENETPERKEKCRKVIESYYAKDSINTKAIAKIKNLTLLFHDNNIYNILENRLEYFSYHEKIKGQPAEKSDLDGTQIKEYFILKDKKGGEMLIKTGESIKRLYEDLGINIPDTLDDLKLRYNEIKVAKEKDTETPIDEVFDTSMDAQILLSEAKKILADARIQADQLINEGVIEQLRELNDKLAANPDYTICLKELMPKRNYLNWLLEKQAKNELPEYVSIIVTKIVKNRASVTKAELLIVYSYYVKNAYIPQHVIGNVIKNVRHLAAQGTVNIERIRPLLERENLTIAELLQVIEAVPNLFEKVKEENTKTVEWLEKTSEKTLYKIIQRILPIYLEDKENLREELSNQIENYKKNLTREEYGLVKSLLKKWTFGVGNVEDDDRESILKNNLTKVEVITELKEKLKKLLVIDRKVDYHEEENERPHGTLSIKEDLPEMVNTQSMEDMINDILTTYTANRKILNSFKNDDLPVIQKLFKHGLLDKNLTQRLESKYTEIHNSGNFTTERSAGYVANMMKKVRLSIVKQVEGLPEIQTLDKYTRFSEADYSKMMSINSMLNDMLKSFMSSNDYKYDEKIKEIEETIEAIKVLDGRKIIKRGRDDSYGVAELDTKNFSLREKTGSMKDTKVTYQDFFQIKSLFKQFLDEQNLQYEVLDEKWLKELQDALINIDMIKQISNKRDNPKEIEFFSKLVYDQGQQLYISKGTKERLDELITFDQEIRGKENQLKNEADTKAKRGQKIKKPYRTPEWNEFNEKVVSPLRDKVIEKIKTDPEMVFLVNRLMSGYREKGTLVRRYTDRSKVQDTEKNLSRNTYYILGDQFKSCLRGETYEYHVSEKMKDYLQDDFSGTKKLSRTEYQNCLKKIPEFEAIVNEVLKERDKE